MSAEQIRRLETVVSTKSLTCALGEAPDGPVLLVKGKRASPDGMTAAADGAAGWTVRLGSARTWEAVILGFLRLAFAAAELSLSGVPVEKFRTRRPAAVTFALGGVALVALVAGRDARRTELDGVQAASAVVAEAAPSMGTKHGPLPVPPKPFSWQKRTPCRTQATETEINGGCWTRVDYPLEQCDQYVYMNKCYTPLTERKGDEGAPRSFDGGG